MPAPPLREFRTPEGSHTDLDLELIMVRIPSRERKLLDLGGCTILLSSTSKCTFGTGRGLDGAGKGIH